MIISNNKKIVKKINEKSNMFKINKYFKNKNYKYKFEKITTKYCMMRKDILNYLCIRVENKICFYGLFYKSMLKKLVEKIELNCVNIDFLESSLNNSIDIIYKGLTFIFENNKINELIIYDQNKTDYIKSFDKLNNIQIFKKSIGKIYDKVTRKYTFCQRNSETFISIHETIETYVLIHEIIETNENKLLYVCMFGNKNEIKFPNFNGYTIDLLQ